MSDDQASCQKNSIQDENIRRKAYQLEIESKSSQFQSVVSSHQSFQSHSQTLTSSVKDLNNLNEFVQDHNRHCKSILDAFNERNQFDLDLDLQQDLLDSSQKSLKNMFNLNLLNADSEVEKESDAVDEIGQHSLPGHKGKFQITGMCLEEKSGFNSKKEADNNNNT